ncbi:MAG: hypothetical protein M3252_00620 [Actinomycetota bacterium]|nr:hypothetical protein [Actinomycetota bacterium]
MPERGNREPVEVHRSGTRARLHHRLMAWDGAARFVGILFGDKLPVDDQTCLVEIDGVVDDAGKFATGVAPSLRSTAIGA